jgi:hypothetical protein
VTSKHGLTPNDEQKTPGMATFPVVFLRVNWCDRGRVFEGVLRRAMKSIFSICLMAWSINLACQPGAIAQADLFSNPSSFDPVAPVTPLPRPERNGELLSQMRRISSYMEEYSVQNNGFYDQEMINALIVQLNQLVPNNPYSHKYLITPDDEQTNELEPMDNGGQNLSQPNRVSVIVDQSLSDLQAEEDRANPPDEWTGDPGAITVITNNRNLFIVWGAGRNGKPIRDPDTNRVAVLFGHYHLYLHGDI